MAIFSATFRQCAISSPRGRTALTRPISRACFASTMSPVKMISFARSLPTRRTRRCVPPNPGVIPSVTSGNPTFAFSLA